MIITSWFTIALLIVSSWYTRFCHDRAGAKTDFIWVLSLWYLATPRDYLGWSLGFWGFSLSVWYLMYYDQKNHKQYMTEVKDEFQKCLKEIDLGLHCSKPEYTYADWSPMKPLIFPCRTSHTRIFPRKHSFSYSYLFVGIPIGWRGYVSTVLSADLKALPRRDRPPQTGWFNVDSADHLARGDSVHGLQGKLDDYLRSQVSPLNLRSHDC